MGPGVDTAAAAGGNSDIVVFVVVAVFWVAFFSWVTVVGWAIQRRKEREAYYRHETENRFLDKGELSAEQLLGLRNQEEHARWLRRREGLKLGGVVTTALAIGFLAAFQFVDPGGRSLAGIGGIALIIGLALLLYVYALYPEYKELDANTTPSPTDKRSRDRHD